MSHEQSLTDVLARTTVEGSVLVAADVMISFRFNQSDTERAGRTMTLTKPQLRMSLGNTHFKQAAWVAFNSPGFHEIDVMALVKRWKADGHLSAVMKDASGPRGLRRCWSARRGSTR